MLKEEAILCTKPKQNKKYRYVYVEYEDLKDIKLYCYLDTKKVVKKNDRVIVDRAGQNIGAKVINIVEYDPNEVPYPVEKTKKIIKIIDKDFIIEKQTNYEEYDTIYDYYKNMESLFDKIKNNIEKNGFLSDKFTLEPYLIDNKLSNYPDGEIDNIMPPFKNDEFIKFMKELFNELNDDNINEKVYLTDQYIYENNEVRTIGNIDILIDYLKENEKQIEPKNTYIYALYLIFTAKHPETLKIGISLLSLFPIDKDDNIVKDLEQISLCEEFTKFTNFVFNNIETSNEIRFKLAKKTKAWGKISLVKDLIPENNNIKDWLITNGVTNDIDNSYLAYPITRKIDIINELNNKNLYEEQLIGISKIIDALLNDRIHEYENKEELFTTYFNINYKFYNNISYNLTLLNILEYLNYNRISITLRKNITKYFKTQKVLTIIENNLYNQNFESSCLILYKLNNNNYNEIIYNKLKNNNLILPNAIKLLLKDKKYYQKTINIINNYDLSKYYGKPLPHILKDDNNLNNLLKLINIIEIYPFLTEKIIIDGLKCQYANIRLSTLNTLIKWLKLSNKKYKHLSNNLKDILIELYNNEQVKQIKEELNKLIELKDDLSSFKDNKIKIIKNYKIFDLYKDNLKELFTDLIIERGKEYYDDDMIYNVVKTKDKYTLYVQGSTFDKEYIVIIRYEDSKLISMYCNCPYENNCKHECASIIYIREHNNKN